MNGGNEQLKNDLNTLIDQIDRQENMIKGEFTEMQSLLDNQFKQLETNICQMI